MTCAALADIPGTLAEVAVFLWASAAGWEPEATQARQNLATMGVRLDVEPEPGALEGGSRSGPKIAVTEQVAQACPVTDGPNQWPRGGFPPDPEPVTTPPA